jgi:hypothetical protein
MVEKVMMVCLVGNPVDEIGRVYIYLYDILMLSIYLVALSHDCQDLSHESDGPALRAFYGAEACSVAVARKTDVIYTFYTSPFPTSTVRLCPQPKSQKLQQPGFPSGPPPWY